MSSSWPDDDRRQDPTRQHYPEDFADGTPTCPRDDCDEDATVATPDGTLCNRHARLLAAAMEVGRHGGDGA